jgi:hypothetical protein
VSDFNDLIRCLRVIAMTREQLMALAHTKSEERDWFLKSVDALAPELHQRGWIRYGEFRHVPGDILVTTGQGDVRTVFITDRGLGALDVTTQLSVVA